MLKHLLTGLIALFLGAACVHAIQPAAVVPECHTRPTVDRVLWVKEADVLPTDSKWWICRPDANGDLHCMDLIEATEEMREESSKGTDL